MIKTCLLVILIFTIIWGIAFIYCDDLTRLYSNEFTECANSMPNIYCITGWRVLKYSKEYAEVYYYYEINGELDGGVAVSYNKKEDSWIKDREISIWSRQGSADDNIWPYHIIGFDNNPIKFGLNICIFFLIVNIIEIAVIRKTK